MNVVEMLEQAKALIENPDHWIQHSYARISRDDPEGIFGSDPAATCWCSVGALQKVDATGYYGYEKMAAVRYLCNVLAGSGEEDTRIVKYNDTHTHEEVMRVWDLAIQKAKADHA